MESSRHVPPQASVALHAALPGGAPLEPLADSAQRALLRTRRYLLDVQHPDGHWVGELEGDTILESEYILLLAWLRREPSDEIRKAARYIAAQQLPGGGWSIYPGGGLEISASVKAYFALKLAGHDPSSEPLERARHAILRAGGADAVNSFTRFYLALLGQISYEQCPAVPPEVVLLPGWFPVNLSAVSAWSRTILVPLSVMSAFQPVTRIEPSRAISELFLRSPDQWPPLRCPGLEGSTGLVSWDRFFRLLDAGLKWCRRHGVLPLRRRALAAAEQWIIDRFHGSEGLGAIFPPMVWSIVALRCLGYADHSPELEYCFRHLRGLVIEDGQTLRIQPCKSPVWDTALSLRALSAAGIEPADPAVERGVDWLLDMQIDRPGDWSQAVNAPSGGWCFEHANDFYPDVDDTAMVLMALAESRGSAALSPDPHENETFRARREQGPGAPVSATPNPPERERWDRAARLQRTAGAIDRAQRWIQSMQNRDGGWGAFDRDNDREFLCYVPFADHNAMIDPSTPDLAGRVLEAFGTLGRRLGDPAVDPAVAYLRRTQEADGSWFGRWGVNYIYGTWQVLTGLAAVGVAGDDPAVAAGIQWLLVHQQRDGAWGESPDSYADPRRRGQGPPTASQTAWAVLGLVSAGKADHPAAARGIAWLLTRQCDDGAWDEPEFTGTGFPRVFYLRYHLYPVYFPLLALARWAAAVGSAPDALDEVGRLAGAPVPA